MLFHCSSYSTVCFTVILLGLTVIVVVVVVVVVVLSIVYSYSYVMVQKAILSVLVSQSLLVVLLSLVLLAGVVCYLLVLLVVLLSVVSGMEPGLAQTEEWSLAWLGWLIIVLRNKTCLTGW